MMLTTHDKEFFERVGARGTDEIIEYADDALLYIVNSAMEIERLKNEIEMLKEGIKKLSVIPEGKSKFEIIARLRDPNEQAEAYTSTLCEDAADLIKKLDKDNENISGLLKESYEEDDRKHKEIVRLKKKAKMLWEILGAVKDCLEDKGYIDAEMIVDRVLKEGRE